ncbi:MAG: TolC family outer membrane protein [Gallionella sp.]
MDSRVNPMKIKLLTFFLVSTLGVGNVAMATDLLDIYHDAQNNDPVFLAARASKRVGEEKLPQARALLMPTVNLTANSTFHDISRHYNKTFLFPGKNRYNDHGYGVTLIQPLFRQQNWLLYTEAELQVAQTDAQYKLAEQDLVLRAAQSYFDVLIAQDSVQLAEAQKMAIAEQLAKAKIDFQVGTATITDTNEAQSRYDLIISQEIAAQNNREVKRGALQQLVNLWPPELKKLGPQFKLEAPQPASMEKWLNNAQLNSPKLAIAQAGVELANKEVARNRGAHYPTLDLVANYSKNYANGGAFGVGSQSTTKSVGVQFNLPIFQGGALNSKWREAEANRERARQELENARRSIAQQTRQSYLGVVSGIAQVKALQQALISGKSVLEASQLGQEVGVRTNLDVLNAQQQLYSTRRDLYQAEYNYLLSELRLKAAVGELGETALARVNQALH